VQNVNIQETRLIRESESNEFYCRSLFPCIITKVITPTITKIFAKHDKF